MDMRKRLHKHGGSKALDLPMHFVKKLPSDYVNIKEQNECLLVCPADKLTSMEEDPLFADFINALLADAMKNPSQLTDLREVWDAEWDDLLEGVDTDDED